MDTVGKMYWPIVKGRDGERSPMQWNGGPNAGFSQARPWLPLNDDYSETNVEVQLREPTSLLNFYRSLTAIRREKPTLQKGSYEKTPSHRDIMSYCRVYQNERLYVMLNFSANRLSHTCTPAGRWSVLMGTQRNAGTVIGKEGFDVYPYEILVLEEVK
jgi:alpha-glucosidase